MHLQHILRSKGIKQKWLAQKLGVSEVSVSNWMQNRATPKPEHLEKLSSILDIPLDQLQQIYGQ